MPTLEDLIFDCNARIKAARAEGQLATLAVLEAQLERLFDNYRAEHPARVDQ
jgi:hypothetical protein